MAHLIVTYDLNEETKQFDPWAAMLEYLSANYYYARLSESSYVIRTDKRPSEVYDEIQEAGIIDGNDYCLVCPTGSYFAGQNDAEVIEWLKNEGLIL